jgi:hypothetical protein
MLCSSIKCSKMKDFGFCSIFNPDGQRFRDRQGYCPVPDDGPNRATPKVDTKKKRFGQQKQSKRGR